MEVPPYHSKAVSSAVQVQFYVCNGKRKKSQSQRFTYLSGESGGSCNFTTWIYIYFVVLQVLNFNVFAVTVLRTFTLRDSGFVSLAALWIFRANDEEIDWQQRQHAHPFARFSTGVSLTSFLSFLSPKKALLWFRGSSSTNNNINTCQLFVSQSHLKLPNQTFFSLSHMLCICLEFYDANLLPSRKQFLHTDNESLWFDALIFIPASSKHSS